MPATLQTLSEIMNAHERALQAPSSTDGSEDASADASAFAPVLDALRLGLGRNVRS